MLNQQRRWLRLLAWLRREFPAQVQVKVRSVVMKDDAETYTYRRRGCIYVDINKNKSYGTMSDAAIHEWAHVLTWFGAEHKEEHPAEWGVCYAKIYNAYDNWNPPKIV